MFPIRRIGRFSGYSRLHFRRDLTSGFTVAAIALPLGLSFAIASGVEPVYGIYTTVVAGILISLFGGSRFQIGGPTGAFVPVLLGIVLTEGYKSLLLSGMMAGILLVLMGVFRMGALVRYIPRPVTVGFTAGIAVIIFVGQIANFLGLRGIEKHEAFLPNVREIMAQISTINGYSVLTGAICLAVILMAARISRRLPGAILGLAVSTVAALWLYPGEVATIGTVFGAIPAQWPAISMPSASWGEIVRLLPLAFVVAILGAVESLLSAVVADQMTGTRHDSNREMIGQGIANIVTPLFGGIPATGAIARTAANIRHGAATPVAGIIHSVAVLIILLAFADYAADIPLAAMAPILMVVAWNMSERKEFRHLIRVKNGDAIVMTATFLLTVLTSLTLAVGAGLGLAAILFIKRMGEVTGMTKAAPDPSSKHRKVHAHQLQPERECPQLQIFTLEGALFFGATDLLGETAASQLRTHATVLILRMGKVLYLDMTGESQLRLMVRELRKQGMEVYISGLQPQPRELLARSGFITEVGETRFLRTRVKRFCLHYRKGSIMISVKVACATFFKSAPVFPDPPRLRRLWMNLELQRFKAEFFKALAHPLRIRILEVLADGVKSVNEIQAALGSEGSAVSQQLSVLRSKNIVQGQKDGNRVLYSLRDPMIVDLLTIAKQIFSNHLIDTISMLDEFSEAASDKSERPQLPSGGQLDGRND